LTVSTTTNRIAYTGNGVTVAFAFPNLFFANTDLKVYVDDVLKVLTTDYSVTGAGASAGGNVTFGSAPENMSSVVIFCEPDSLQSTQLPSNGPFPSAAVETMSDKLTVLLQRALDRVERTLRLSDGDSGTGGGLMLPIQTVRANKYLVFDASGTISVSAGTGTDTGLRADLADAAIGDSLVAVKGSATGEVAKNLSAYLNLNVKGLKKNFGAIGGGAVDDTTAILTAFSSGKVIEVEEGRFLFKDTIYPPVVSGTIVGHGVGRSIIDHQPATAKPAVWFGNHTQDTPSPYYTCLNPVMRDISIYCGVNTTIGLRVRESIGADFSNVFVGAETQGVLTNIIAFMVDGAINGSFHKIESRPFNGYNTPSPLIRAFSITQSLNLAASAGSGSGASITSTTFSAMYAHLTGTLGRISSANGVKFTNHCIFEAASEGVTIADAFLAEFDAYFESITGHPILGVGADTRNHSNVRICGGYQQGNARSGYNSDSFVKADFASVVDIHGMQMTGDTVAIGKILTAANCDRIIMDAMPFPLHMARTHAADSEFAVTNGIATTNASATLRVTKAAHGLPVGSTVGLKGFTTPISNYALNLPFYQVTAVPDADHIDVVQLYNPALTANATASGLGGTGTLIVYRPSVWVNAIIDQADVTTLTDCEAVELKFRKAFGGAAGPENLYLDGDTATTSVQLDDWFYIMSVEQYRSDGSVNVTPTSLRVALPSGYESLISVATVNAFAGTNKYSTRQAVGLKFPPGSSVSVVTSVAGAVTAGATVRVARTRVTGVVEA
jgi:hypothetical protein